MGVPGSAAAGRVDVRAGSLIVPASHRGVIALYGAARGMKALEPFLQ